MEVALDKLASTLGIAGVVLALMVYGAIRVYRDLRKDLAGSRADTAKVQAEFGEARKTFLEMIAGMASEQTEQLKGMDGTLDNNVLALQRVEARLQRLEDRN